MATLTQSSSKNYIQRIKYRLLNYSHFAIVLAVLSYPKIKMLRGKQKAQLDFHNSPGTHSQASGM